MASLNSHLNHWIRYLGKFLQAKLMQEDYLIIQLLSQVRFLFVTKQRKLIFQGEEKSVAFQNSTIPSYTQQNSTISVNSNTPSVTPVPPNNYVSSTSEEHNTDPKLRRGISWSEQVAVRIFEKDSDEENDVEEVTNTSSNSNDEEDVDTNTLNLVSVPSTYPQPKTKPPSSTRRELPPRPSSSPNLNSNSNSNNSLRNNTIPSKNSQQPPSNVVGVPPLPFKAVALYDFQGSEKIEMSFKEGDIVFVTRMKGSWWYVSCNFQDSQKQVWRT